MKNLLLPIFLAATLPHLAAPSPVGAQVKPYVQGRFQGRIAYSADGNHNDPDDWAASPVALAILAEAGVKDRLVHFDYNCILPETNPDWEKKHAESVLGAAERYRFDPSVFFDCRRNLEQALASLARAINDSSADNPLYLIIAGPVEVPWRGIEKSDPAKRAFVYCISHSRWNDGFASQYTFTFNKRNVIEQNVHWTQIRDQNRLLSLSPYKRPARPEEFAGFFWMRDSRDPRVQFLWERMLVSTRPDPSDAGMAYFLVTGDEDCDPAKLERLIGQGQFAPPVAARQQVRMEAENFRQLEGFVLEDRKDKNASHQLNVTLGDRASGRIRTPFDEPFARATGRYDADIRFLDEKGIRRRYAFFVNGVQRGDAWESPGVGRGWMSHTIRAVEVRTGDEIRVDADGAGARLDYVQLNSLDSGGAQPFEVTDRGARISADGLERVSGVTASEALGQGADQVKTSHPRVLIADVRETARRCEGPLAEDYRVVKQRADAAVRRGGIEFIANGWAIPEDLMNCGLAFLVEREAGREHRPYAEVIIRQWGDGRLIANPQGSHFGYHALAYDWIFDALTPEQRVRYGNALGSWLRFFTDRPEILLKYGHWEYNQTWGPIHLNIMNCRDALTQKLFIALAIFGAGTRHEADARAFLDSWHQRVPSECLPAFDRMGGVWSESYGHGGYGPVTVIPYAFQAWRTATGIDYFKQLKPWGYPVESPQWVAYTMMPYNERTAWIDDGDGAKPSAFARAAPMLRDGLSQWFSERGRDWLRERWQRVACFDPSIPATPPDGLPLGYLFPGAGHVYMRSGWNDPNATWAFFGCGPQFAGHARDDEGHFLICKQGALVSRQGGQGHNDSDYYSGGSLIYNIVTIFDPNEKFRRDKANENDGGLLRHVYEGGSFPRERGHLVAFEHNPQYTYAAADLTKGYNTNKAREVARQFLYLRGKREFFVVFDRVEAARAEFRRHFFLHVPTEPEVTGKLLTWLSLPEADGDKSVLSRGRSRMFLRALLPANAEIVKRGGPGQEAWGHPLEPTAQYNHTSEGRKQPPLCPWRIEMGDPGAGTRTLFLHVFEIGDETLGQPTEVKFIAPAGLDIGDRWRVRFHAAGPLGGQVGDRALTTTIQTDAQYSLTHR